MKNFIYLVLIWLIVGCSHTRDIATSSEIVPNRTIYTGYCSYHGDKSIGIHFSESDRDAAVERHKAKVSGPHAIRVWEDELPSRRDLKE